MCVSLRSDLGGMVLRYQSPCCLDPKDAKFVLIEDKHDAEIIQKAHARFIDANCSDKDVLLLEGCRAGSIVTGLEKEIVTSLLKISETAGNKLTVIGWDYYTHLSDDGSPKALEERALLLSFLKNWVEEEGGFISPTLIKKVNYLIVEGEKLLKEERFCATLKKGGWFEVVKNPDMILKFSERKQVQVLLTTLKYIMDYKDNGLRIHVPNLMKIIKQIQQILPRDHPIRTAAMIDTIQAMRDKLACKELRGRVFLIAGAAHLSRNSATRDCIFDNSSLYTELDKISAIIVSTRELDPYKETMRETQDVFTSDY